MRFSSPRLNKKMFQRRNSRYSCLPSRKNPWYTRWWGTQGYASPSPPTHTAGDPRLRQSIPLLDSNMKPRKTRWHHIRSSCRPWRCISARGTRHAARGTRHAARGTRHAARGARHAARGTRHAARGTRHAARGTRYAARGTRQIDFESACLFRTSLADTRNHSGANESKLLQYKSFRISMSQPFMLWGRYQDIAGPLSQ
jgi:hypothetical protein